MNKSKPLPPKPEEDELTQTIRRINQNRERHALRKWMLDFKREMKAKAA